MGAIRQHEPAPETLLPRVPCEVINADAELSGYLEVFDMSHVLVMHWADLLRLEGVDGVRGIVRVPEEFPTEEGGEKVFSASKALDEDVFFTFGCARYVGEVPLMIVYVVKLGIVAVRWLFTRITCITRIT